MRRRRLGVHPTGVAAAFPAPNHYCSFPQRFAEIAATHGDRIALCAGDLQETYAELDARTNALARALLDHLGSGSEPVALWFDQTPDAVRACLAVLKAGKFYVPLDASAPDARNAQILDECGARMLLRGVRERDGSALLALSRDRSDRRVLNLDQCAVGVSTAPLDVPIDRHDPAYVTFTSGSTGAPKGVVEDHGDVLYVAWMYRHSHHICPEDRVGLWRRWAFGGGQLHIFAAFCSGASLTLLPSGGSVVDWMAQERVTIMTASPSMLRAMVDSLEAGARLSPSLRAVVIGSEPLLVSDVERLWRVVPPGCVLRNTYGATEALSATALYLAPDDRFDGDVVPAGWVAHDGAMLVLRANGERCDVGEIGDVFVRRASTAAGYWRRPEDTVARFFTDADGMRRYRFGDKGRLSADGCLEVLGRDDDFVKINGFAASTSVVEAALGRLSCVASAAVSVWEDPGGQMRLVAHIVPRDGATAEQIRRALAAQLPPHMVPARIELLARMPLTVTGKVDRRALAAPLGSRPALAQEYVAPRDELERQIAVVWEEVLHVRPIGVRDVFFDLGGDSLRAGQILERLRALTQREAGWGLLQRAPTVERMAQLLQTSDASRGNSLAVVARAEGNLPPLIIFPPASGASIGFMRITSLLSERQPVIVLQPQGLDGVHEPHDSVDAMTTAYLAALDEIGVRGPLRLLGVCRGAYTACAMAQRLAEAGRRVDALIVLDATTSESVFERWRREKRKRIRPKIVVNGDMPWPVVRRLLNQWKVRFRTRIRNRGMSDTVVARVRAANIRAFDQYEIERFNGRALIVESLRSPWLRMRFEAWRQVFVGACEHVRIVSSTHEDLMSGRHAAELARVLGDWLDA